jgi:hypothetical protein
MKSGLGGKRSNLSWPPARAGWVDAVHAILPAWSEVIPLET